MDTRFESNDFKFYLEVYSINEILNIQILERNIVSRVELNSGWKCTDGYQKMHMKV